MIGMRVAMFLVLILAISSVAVGEECKTGDRPPELRASPASQLQNLSGTEFDLVYMRVMYQLHSDIQSLAEQGIVRTSGRGLRILSDGIKHEQMDQNAKLAAWYKKTTGGQLSDFCVQSNPDFDRLGTVLPRDYDTAYARTMIAYLQQARDAAQLAVSKAVMPELRDQAGLTVKAADREITALRNWLNNLPMFG
ncbi:MAG: DUF305 domain-containing protein [Armatimonadetes bacterium]|nr:DUF305 domain-containing protein [Armatimonadota bacterium]